MNNLVVSYEVATMAIFRLGGGESDFRVPITLTHLLRFLLPVHYIILYYAELVNPVVPHSEFVSHDYRFFECF
jgi:hypothetical protein